MTPTSSVMSNTSTTSPGATACRIRWASFTRMAEPDRPQERVWCEPRHCALRLDSSFGVEHQRVDASSHGPTHSRRAHSLEHSLGIMPLHDKFREGGLVKECHRVACSEALFLGKFVPALFLPTSRRMHTISTKPLWSL
eukprot:CAMPEP_0206323110 /NCGR_PEP_ID=MMETSP0106_2-20121207/19791_1 /ASSEMBLY_ACC=CAM_ASM_000206 /TAXON_ID=81532 /ORGANISM="Acanthoeca-like sp., Strain 10tr" /LENGTH=138 /DNA_ID=CAMNT_0053755341 /DNA_START=71 /DNA_END=484 /DNA_ORIENTATION=-